jgi:hypothetical protein
VTGSHSSHGHRPTVVDVAVEPVVATISLGEILTRLEENVANHTKRHRVGASQQPARDVQRRVANVRRLSAELRAELAALGLSEGNDK